MLASQFIYTSWRNSPNAGFSKYSVTPDISQQDCEDIRKMMKYVAQPGLPYQPTWEEIQTIFPVNTSFFPLASGKWCLAQSSYIGHEYRGFEDEGRMGNYLLHALVIDDISDFVPMSFVGESVFLRDLTTEQWRATNPPPLPKIELPSAGAPLSQSEISEFFGAPERLDTLMKLVQAVIAAQTSQATVYFNDSHTNMKYWYKALAMCLPTDYAGKVSFSTYSLTAVKPTDISPCCKLRIVNVSASLDSSVPVSAPGLNEETRKGNFIIDLVRKVYSNITVGEYARTVASKFLAGAFDALSYAKKIDNTVKLYGCSVDRAADINAFLEGKIERFSSIESLLDVLAEVSKRPDARISGTVTAIAERIVKGEFPYTAALSKAIKETVYPRISADMKNRVIGYVLTHAVAATPANSPEDFKRAINESLPCSSDEAIAYIFANRAHDSFISSNRFGGYYLASALLENYGAATARYGAAATEIVERVINELVSAKQLQLLDSLSAKAPSAMASVFTSLVNASAARNQLQLMPTDTLFYLISKSNLSQDNSARIIACAISSIGQSPEFKSAYKSFAAANPQVDAMLRGAPQCRQFFEAMDMDAFMNARLTVNDFINYYNKVYSLNTADTAFEAKLRSHLLGLSWEQAIKDSLAIYSSCFQNKAFVDERDRRVIASLSSAVFDKSPKKQLINALLKNPNLASALENFSVSVIRQGIPQSPNYSVIKLYSSIISQPTDVLLEKIRTKTLWDSVKGSPDKIAAINRELFDDFTQTVLSAVRSKKTTPLFLAHAILPLSVEEKSFTAAFKKTAELMAADEKTIIPAMSGLLIYVATALPPERALAGAFNSYLDTTNKKTRALLVKSACKYAKDTDRMKVIEFINAYNDKHPEGFFAKLKNMFR